MVRWDVLKQYAVWCDDNPDATAAERLQCWRELNGDTITPVRASDNPNTLVLSYYDKNFLESCGIKF